MCLSHKEEDVHLNDSMKFEARLFYNLEAKGRTLKEIILNITLWRYRLKKDNSTYVRYAIKDIVLTLVPKTQENRLTIDVKIIQIYIFYLKPLST